MTGNMEKGYVLDINSKEEIEKYLKETFITLLYYLSAGILLIRKEIDDSFSNWFIEVPVANTMKNVLAGEKLACEFQRVMDYYLNYVRDLDGNLLTDEFESINYIKGDCSLPIKIKYKIINRVWTKEFFIEAKEKLKEEMPVFSFVKKEDENLFEQFYK